MCFRGVEQGPQYVPARAPGRRFSTDCPACGRRRRHAPGQLGSRHRNVLLRHSGIVRASERWAMRLLPSSGTRLDLDGAGAGSLASCPEKGGANRSGSPLRTLRGDKASGRQPQKSPRPHIMVNLPGALHKRRHSPADREPGRQRLRGGFATRPPSNALTERRGSTAERAPVVAAGVRQVR